MQLHHTQQRIPFTREAYEKMQSEAHRLQVELEEIKVRLQTAREMGDLSENGAYHAAKFELGTTIRRLKTLHTLLKTGVIVEKKEHNDVVEFGCTVTLQMGETKTSYMIVSTHESDPKEHKLSIESPLGQALLGKRVGEVVEVTTPMGNKKYTILALS